MHQSAPAAWAAMDDESIGIARIVVPIPHDHPGRAEIVARFGGWYVIENVSPVETDDQLAPVIANHHAELRDNAIVVILWSITSLRPRLQTPRRSTHHAVHVSWWSRCPGWCPRQGVGINLSHARRPRRWLSRATWPPNDTHVSGAAGIDIPARPLNTF
jgi:hypothetical protein